MNQRPIYVTILRNIVWPAFCVIRVQPCFCYFVLYKSIPVTGTNTRNTNRKPENGPEKQQPGEGKHN